MPREIYWSNRFERLHLIEKLFLKQHQNLRTYEIAEKFGVSHSTALRDLYFLSSSGMLSLEKHGRYWKLVKGDVDKSFDGTIGSVEAMQHYDYDVALSYASEDRGYSDALATILQREGVKVFYDKYEKAALWGQDLYTYLSDIYQNKARYCVMFLSQYYAAKLWTSHERQAAQARAFKEQSPYILPIRLDDTVIPGILPTTSYLVWHEETAESLAHTVLEKLANVIRKSKQDYLDESSDFYQKGYRERALIANEQAVRIDPYDSYVHFAKGGTLLGLRHYEDALVSFERAIHLYRDDDGNYIYDVYCSKGQALISLERYEKALEAYEQAIKLDPGKDVSYRISVSSALCDKGETLCYLERYTEALAAYNQAIEIEMEQTYPSRYNIAHAQAGKADVLCNLHRYEEALVECEKAIHNDSKNVYGYNVKGRAISDLERNEE